MLCLIRVEEAERKTLTATNEQTQKGQNKPEAMPRIRGSVQQGEEDDRKKDEGPQVKSSVE